MKASVYRAVQAPSPPIAQMPKREQKAATTAVVADAHPTSFEVLGLAKHAARHPNPAQPALSGLTPRSILRAPRPRGRRVNSHFQSV